jgi:cytochrome c biogenesis protein CcmG, thiol:disulfide interchange protein DsbE
VRSASKKSPGRQALPLLLVGVGLIVLGIASYLLLPRPDQAVQKSDSPVYALPVAVNFPAPDITLQDLQNQPANLSNFSGKVILVNNWATWCPPCKAEMPTLEAYYQDYSAQDFVIVAIEAGEPAEEVAAFVRQHGLSFPVWPDPGLRAQTSFKNDALPSSYVIDRQGQVRLAWIGPISRELLDQYVTPLLEE